MSEINVLVDLVSEEVLLLDVKMSMFSSHPRVAETDEAAPHVSIYQNIKPIHKGSLIMV